jgi:hypothetical protein
VRIETDLGVALARVARAGRLRIIVRDVGGHPVPHARVEVEGNFIAFDTGGSGCPPDDPLEVEENRVVCSTDENGQVTFVLLGEAAIEAVPVTLTAASADEALQGQLQTRFIPPATLDGEITVASP